MLPKVPTLITLLSVIPFVIMSLIITFEWVENVETVLELLISYAAIIISFLAGTRWGMAIDHQEVHDTMANRLYMMSTTMVIFAWMVTIIPDYLTQLLALTILYTLAWGADSILYNSRIIPLWFFTIRSIVTPVIIVSLYTGYFSIL